MSDELDEELVSQPVEESQPTEIEETVDSATDDPEALKAKIADLESKNKQLYERVKKADKPKETLPTKQSSNSYATKEDVERIALEAKGYSSDEVNTLMRYGGLKALDDSIIMSGIEAARKAKKSIDATPGSTGKSPVYQKYTERDLKSMTTEELEKIIPN